MEHQKVMYAFNDDTKWKKILGDATGLLERPEFIDKIVVIAMGTAVLSLLRSSILEEFKSEIHEMSNKGVEFYMCQGTLTRFGITPNMLLPDIKIATEGSDIKILELKEAGYTLFALPYI